jgi:hypothetical protein
VTLLRIPPDAVIPEEKLTHYLLVPRVEDDKSKFLAQAGFTQDNPTELLTVIRQLADIAEAVEDGNNQFGDFYRVEGYLTGPNGHTVAVVLIWLQWYQDKSFHFITLKPWRRPENET